MAVTALVTSAAVVMASGVALDAAAAKSGGTCASRLVGTVTADAKGQPLVCTKLSKTKFQWKLPALGSFLRPIALGAASAAGPSVHRFTVRVTRVNFDATAEVAAEFEYFVAPPADVRVVRVDVQATFTGPAATGETGHYWSARTADGVVYPASAGCGGGYGTTFDVTTQVAIGGVVSGSHCFEVPAAVVDTLRFRMEGSDRPDTYFALR